MRRDSGISAKEAVERLLNSKLKPENRDDALVLADSGENDDVDAVEGDGDDGLNAVLRRRSDFLGWSGCSLGDGILNLLLIRCCRDQIIVCGIFVFEGRS